MGFCFRLLLGGIFKAGFIKNEYSFNIFMEEQRYEGTEPVLIEALDNLYTEVCCLREQNKIMDKALDYYGSRTGMGGTARKAKEECTEVYNNIHHINPEAKLNYVDYSFKKILTFVNSN